LSTRASQFFHRLGLDRPEVRAWALYDWATAAFFATIVAAVFPIYFSTVAAAGLPATVAATRFALTTTAAMVIVAALAPVVGALADYYGINKRLLAASMGLGVVATGCMVFIRPGDWLLASFLFGAANIGASFAFVFYDSLLVHITSSGKEMDRISTTGYAVGYLGGGLLLGLNLAWISYPRLFGMADAAEAARLSFFSVAIWWLAFSIPLLRCVAEPPARRGAGDASGLGPLRAARQRLLRTFHDLRAFKQAFLFLLAFLIYNDGIGTIIRMAALYGTQIGLPRGALIGAILVVQFIGVPFAVLFGSIASRVGVKGAIFLSLAVYLVISIVAFFMQTALHFYLLAGLVATVQGGSQALSRSLFARLVPRFRSAEFFAFFSMGEKLAGILGPGVFAAVTILTGSSRGAILSLVVFFIVGGLLVAAVDVTEGERVAREAEMVRGHGS
jgi:UMF1 family MFS transporter